MTNAQLIEAANQAEARLALAVKEQRLAKPTATATKALARLFSQQGKIAAAQVRKAIRESLREASSDDVNDIAANAMVTVNKATGRKLKDTLEATAASSMRQGSDANRQRLGIESLSFSLKNPRAEAYVRKRGLESSKSIDEETKSRLRTIIADGMDQGLSPFEIGDLIEEEFDYMGEETGQSYLRTRADLIATTETAAGYGAGEQMVVDDLIDNGLDMIKFWSNTGDDKVSDVCLENTAAGWIGGDEDFPSGDQRPPGHPGCRCCTLDRIDPRQRAGESLREAKAVDKPTAPQYNVISFTVKDEYKGKIDPAKENILKDTVNKLAAQHPNIELLNVHVDKLPFNIPARYDALNKRITVNVSLASSGPSLSQPSPVGFSVAPEEGKELEAIIAHEIGHASWSMERMVCLLGEDNAERMFATLRPYLGRLGVYSGANLNELMAEAYTAMLYGADEATRALGREIYQGVS